MIKKIFIAILLFASCNNSKKQLIISPSNIYLGVVKVGDTMGYKISFLNASKKDSILVKGISSNCTCAIVASDSFCIPPLATKVVSGKYIGKKDDLGRVTQRIAVHSDSDSAFQFVTLNATVQKSDLTSNR